MKVSVALTTYNGEKYITAQLDSILKQTYAPDEVIICDDSSTDNTCALIRKYIENYQLENKWKLVINESNKGYADNFYDTVNSCNGDIIFFCDQDDIWKKNKVEVMTHIMENNDIELLCSRFTNFNIGEKIEEKEKYEHAEIHKVYLNSKSIYLQIPGCAMAVRKRFWKKIEEFWYSGFAHDEYVWKLGMCVGGVYVYDESLVNRRCHENNTSMKKMRTRELRIAYVEDLIKSYEAMLKFLGSVGEDRKEHEKLILHNIDGCKKREKLLTKRKILYLPELFLRYSDTVKTRKTFLIEAYLAFK